jgi:hypothetical protein
LTLGSKKKNQKLKKNQIDPKTRLLEQQLGSKSIGFWNSQSYLTGYTYRNLEGKT